ncbi:MAG: response regulator [Chloroflexota bacterium]
MGRPVLVVENDPGLLTVYDNVLQRCGCDMVGAPNYDEAVHLLERLTPEVVFLDMMLPGRNGDGVLAYIDQAPHLKRTRVVVVTSNVRFHQLTEAYPGINFILKPILPAQIRQFVQVAAV